MEKGWSGSATMVQWYNCLCLMKGRKVVHVLAFRLSACESVHAHEYLHVCVWECVYAHVSECV